MKTIHKAISSWLYDKGPGQYYRPAYGHIAEAVGVRSGIFLDVGCGPGWLGIHVARRSDDVQTLGIDLCPTMIAQARGHAEDCARVGFAQMDAARIDAPDEHFQGAASVQSAHHWTATEAILSEVHRVLKPGARFLIYEADRHLERVPDGWIQRRRAWPPAAVVRLGWRRFGMDKAEWDSLMGCAQRSPFRDIRSDRHGFYRRLVLLR